MSVLRLSTTAFVAVATCLTLGCGRDSTNPLAPELTNGGDSRAVDPCVPDVLAPSITGISASRASLWAPNHKLVALTVTVAASDNCSPVTSRITGVTSNEPVNGLGDGNTEPDWVVMGPLTLLLRSERSGRGTGRVYTIAVQATDASGNASTGATTVVVPHDQRK